MFRYQLPLNFLSEWKYLIHGEFTLQTDLFSCAHDFFRLPSTHSSQHQPHTFSITPAGWFKFNMIYDYFWYRTIELFCSKLPFRRTGGINFSWSTNLFAHKISAARSVYLHNFCLLLSDFPLISSQTHPRKLFAFASNSSLFMEASHVVSFLSPHASR